MGPHLGFAISKLLRYTFRYLISSKIQRDYFEPLESLQQKITNRRQNCILQE